MTRFGRLAGALLILLSVCPIVATTWRQVELDDPFSDGTCPAVRITSSGSYIYNAPSKFDGVYFPQTSPSWYWLCPESGYAALGDDFEELAESDRLAVGKFLVENYDSSRAPESVLEKLLWMEKIYRHREMDDEFWALFYRLQAHWHTVQNDVIKASVYRDKALPLMKELLKELPPGGKRIKYLFLVGEYHRQQGDMERAKEFFRELRATRWTDEDGKLVTGHAYFEELIDDHRQLQCDD